jgi:DNA-binding NarL/FixJ family response regulator
MYSDITMVRYALQCGAKGYLVKCLVTKVLLLAINTAIKGEIYLSPVITEPSANDCSSSCNEKSDSIDLVLVQEREVLRLITEGYTEYAIAQLLISGVKTVKKYRADGV